MRVNYLFISKAHQSFIAFIIESYCMLFNTKIKLHIFKNLFTHIIHKVHNELFFEIK